MILDIRFVSFMLWGVGTVIIYGVVLWGRRRAYRAHRDRRSLREFLAAAGLFITALGAGAATALVLLGNEGAPMRSFSVSLALGAFTGAGIVMLMDRADEKS